MPNSDRFVSNAASSVLQTVISGLIMIVLYRYLIDRLGQEQLGLWSVILASTSVARLSDLGLTGSVVKFVARYRALKNDSHASILVQTATISIALALAAMLPLVYPLLCWLLRIAIPGHVMPQAIEILPWALLSLWLGSVGGIFQAGLDGCQRMDLRNIILIFGNLLFFLAAFWFVPTYGLLGLAIGQAVQSLLILLMSWTALGRALPLLPWIPRRWSKAGFSEMLGYAVNFQVSALAMLLFEPATKLLMSRFGGLASAAYYEMASQLVLRLRALVIAVNQTLVPTVATLQANDPNAVYELYLKSYTHTLYVALPFYASIAASLPLIALLWLGRGDMQFIIFGVMLALSWGLNTLTSNAYFTNLGTGDLKWNTLSHLIIAIVNVFLGIIFGAIFGGYGVALGAAVALVTGSWYLGYEFHKSYKLTIKHVLPIASYRMVTTTLSLAILSLGVSTHATLTETSVVKQTMCLSVYLLLLGSAMWKDPYYKAIVKGKFELRKSGLR